MHIVLLPGLDGTGDCFEPFLRVVEDSNVIEKTTVIRYRHDCVQSYAELEIEVRAQLPESEAFALLGESFSGPIALSIAATPPSNLKGVILVATFAKNPRPWLRNLRFALPLISIKLAPDILINFALLGRDQTPALCRLLHKAIEQLDVSVFQGRLQQILAVDYQSRASQIALPCIYLRALDDKLVLKSASDSLIGVLKNVKAIDVPAPHFLLQVAPEVAAQHIQKFIAALTSPAPITSLHQTAQRDVS